MAGASPVRSFAAAEPRRRGARRPHPDRMHPQREPELPQFDVQRRRQRRVERAGRKFQAQAAVADVEEPGGARTDRRGHAGDGRARPAAACPSAAPTDVPRVGRQSPLNVSIVKGRARYVPPRRRVSVSRVASCAWSVMSRRTRRVVSARAERQVKAVELAQADVGDEQRQVRNREQTPPRLVERRHGFDRVAELPQRVRDRSQLDGIRFDDQRGLAHILCDQRPWVPRNPLPNVCRIQWASAGARARYAATGAPRLPMSSRRPSAAPRLR